MNVNLVYSEMQKHMNANNVPVILFLARINSVTNFALFYTLFCVKYFLAQTLFLKTKLSFCKSGSIEHIVVL